MLTVQFGNFGKRKNSTARPASLAASFSVALKENTSIDNPVFKLTAPAFDYNYCKWDDRYYFVVDIVSERNNGWSVTCELDLLATYRAEVLATTAFVEYAAQGNSQIVDARIGVEYGVGNVATTNSTLDLLTADGSYILAIVGATSTDLYKVDRSTIRGIMNAAAAWSYNAIDRTDMVSVLASTATQLLAMGNAPQNVRAAYWLPIDVSGMAGVSAPLVLGEYETSLTGRALGGSFMNEQKTIAIPHRYSDWRKQNPYETVYLHLPLYGTINIPSDLACDSDALKVSFLCDIQSGDYTYLIQRPSSLTNEIVVGGNMRSEMLIGASNTTPSKTLGALSMAAIGAAVNPIAGFAGAAATLQTLQPLPYTAGAMGGSSNLIYDLQCFVLSRNTAEEPQASAYTHGIPLFKTVTLRTLTGYAQTRGASVSGTLHGEQYDRVNAMLDSGVFIE